MSNTLYLLLRNILLIVMEIVEQEKIPKDQKELKEWLKKLLQEFKKGKISAKEFYETASSWLLDTPEDINGDIVTIYEEDMTPLDKLWDLVVIQHHDITWQQKIPKMMELIGQL